MENPLFFILPAFMEYKSFHEAQKAQRPIERVSLEKLTSIKQGLQAEKPPQPEPVPVTPPETITKAPELKAPPIVSKVPTAKIEEIWKATTLKAGTRFRFKDKETEEWRLTFDTNLSTGDELVLERESAQPTVSESALVFRQRSKFILDQWLRPRIPFFENDGRNFTGGEAAEDDFKNYFSALVSQGHVIASKIEGKYESKRPIRKMQRLFLSLESYDVDTTYHYYLEGKDEFERYLSRRLGIPKEPIRELNDGIEGLYDSVTKEINKGGINLKQMTLTEDTIKELEIFEDEERWADFSTFRITKGSKPTEGGQSLGRSEVRAENQSRVVKKIERTSLWVVLASSVTLTGYGVWQLWETGDAEILKFLWIPPAVALLSAWGLYKMRMTALEKRSQTSEKLSQTIGKLTQEIEEWGRETREQMERLHQIMEELSERVESIVEIHEAWQRVEEMGSKLEQPLQAPRDLPAEWSAEQIDRYYLQRLWDERNFDEAMFDLGRIIREQALEIIEGEYVLDRKSIESYLEILKHRLYFYGISAKGMLAAVSEIEESLGLNLIILKEHLATTPNSISNIRHDIQLLLNQRRRAEVRSETESKEPEEKPARLTWWASWRSSRRDWRPTKEALQAFPEQERVKLENKTITLVNKLVEKSLDFSRVLRNALPTALNNLSGYGGQTEHLEVGIDLAMHLAEYGIDSYLLFDSLVLHRLIRASSGFEDFQTNLGFLERFLSRAHEKGLSRDYSTYYGGIRAAIEESSSPKTFELNLKILETLIDRLLANPKLNWKKIEPAELNGLTQEAIQFYQQGRDYSVRVTSDPVAYQTQSIQLLPREESRRAEVRELVLESKPLHESNRRVAQDIGRGVADRILAELDLLPEGKILSEPRWIAQSLEVLHSNGLSAEEVAALIRPVIEGEMNQVLERTRQSLREKPEILDRLMGTLPAFADSFSLSAGDLWLAFVEALELIPIPAPSEGEIYQWVENVRDLIRLSVRMTPEDKPIGLQLSSLTQENLNQARNLFNVIQTIHQNAVIEDRSLQKLKDSPNRVSLLEDYLRTLRDTLVLKPDLKVRLLTTSEAERELAKLRNRVIDELADKEVAKAIRARIEIVNAEAKISIDDRRSPINLVLVDHASPVSLKEFHALQAFDSAEDMNGNSLDQVTPAARFLASLASLSEATVKGLRKFEYENGIIVKAENEAAFSPFALLVQMIAQEARAELRMANAA